MSVYQSSKFSTFPKARIKASPISTKLNVSRPFSLLLHWPQLLSPRNLVVSYDSVKNPGLQNPQEYFDLSLKATNLALIKIKLFSSFIRFPYRTLLKYKTLTHKISNT